MRSKLRIVADENMPHIAQLFADIAEVELFDGRHLTNAQLASADALLCRSVTRADAQLLQATPVSFVGTATIGTDHLDTDWLNRQQISWANAAGCNAAAVAQYVLSAIAYWLINYPGEKNLQDLKVGIVGAGNVGSILAHYLMLLQIDFLLCDPPLEAAGDSRDFTPLLQTTDCDVISLHTPLTKLAPYPTHHLIDRTFLSNLGQDQLLINAARGGVIDNSALLDYLRQPQRAQVVLDVFESEPQVAPEFADGLLLATPHIAGHTLEGKSRGSYMVYQAFCRHFDLPVTQAFNQLLPPPNLLEDGRGSSDLLATLLTLYDIAEDSDAFKRMLKAQANPQAIATAFDLMRKAYPRMPRKQLRRDYSGWLANSAMPANIIPLLQIG